jgi:NAD(P)H-nitrite reductase large subunit
LNIEGIDAKGVHTFQTFNDAKGILKDLGNETKAVIIGAGLIGMRAAYALSKNGVKSTLVEMADRIMPVIMDKPASDILVKAMEEEGTSVVLNATVEKVLTDKGRVTGVKISGGKEIACNMLLATAGVVPNVEFLKDSGIDIGRGIRVDQFLQTNKEDIFAAGDIVEFTDKVSGMQAVNANWPNAHIQGSVAGANMAGEKKPYDGSIGLNSIECGNVPSITMGLVNPEGDDYRVLTHGALENNLYKKLVFAKGRLVGAILIGPIRSAGLLLQLINEKVDVAGLEEQILKEGKGFFDLIRGLNRKEMEGNVAWPESLSSQEHYEKKFNDEKWAEREEGRRKW